MAESVESTNQSVPLQSDIQPEFEIDTDPDEQLRFEGPFAEPMTVELKMTNKTSNPVATKVKCTDNVLFKIRPVISGLSPGESQTVRITATLKDGKPPKGRPHHFLVTYTEASGEKKPREVWKEALEGGKCKFPERRLSVIFVEGEVGGDEEAPPAE